MLPIQIGENELDHFNNQRRRRTLILISFMLIFLLFFQILSKNVEVQNIEEEVPNLSVCQSMKLDIYEKLVNNTPEHYDQKQQECFNYLLLESISFRNFRGLWVSEDFKGKFFLQPLALYGSKHNSIHIRAFYFKGEYIDDPRTSVQLALNETGQKGITYNGETRTLIFSNYTGLYSESDFYHSYEAKECLIDMNISFHDIHSFNETNTKQLSLLVNVDAHECGNNFKAFATAMQQRKDYQHKSFIYSCFMSAIGMIQIISCISLLKAIYENNLQPDHFSLVTLGMITAQDAYLSILHFYFALSLESFFTHFITPAFVFFLSFSVFQMRLLISSWRYRQEFIIDNNQLRNSLLKFYMAYYGFMITMSYLLYEYSLQSWFLILMSLYLIPQIIHSAQRGQYQKMNKFYAFGMIGSRVLIVLYFKGCPDNMFEFRPNYLTCFVATILIGLQIIVYYLQEVRGPRFFIPKMFLPKKYNYFMELPDQVDFDRGVSQEVQGLFQEECSVCINPLHQTPALNLTEQEELNPYIRQLVEEGRGKIMKTPCDHKFHSICLAKWMSIKMSCPSCRSPLPAI